MRHNVGIIAATVAALFCGTVYSQKSVANLQISVVKRTYGDQIPKPFVGVGVFDLLRGGSKLEGASCPDKSGAAGSVSCFIPCQPDTSAIVTISVRPPSNQDHLAGWVTPASQDIELRGCKLAPESVMMRYEDAQYALNDLLLKKYASTSPTVANSAAQWKELIKLNQLLVEKLTVNAAVSSDGKKDLVEIYRFASEGSKAYKVPITELSSEEVDNFVAFKKWQTISKNALLGAQLRQAVSAAQFKSAKFEATDDVALYLVNLENADALLGNIKGKTPEQLKLSDDIKTLRSLSGTGKDAQAVLPILKQWK